MSQADTRIIMRDALQMILLAAISGDMGKEQIARIARDALAAEREARA